MIQSVIIGILLFSSCIFLARMVYKSFTSRSCETGCGTCNTPAAESILKTLEKSKH